MSAHLRRGVLAPNEGLSTSGPLSPSGRAALVMPIENGRWVREAGVEDGDGAPSGPAMGFGRELTDLVVLCCLDPVLESDPAVGPDHPERELPLHEQLADVRTGDVEELRRSLGRQLRVQPARW